MSIVGLGQSRSEAEFGKVVDDVYIRMSGLVSKIKKHQVDLPFITVGAVNQSTRIQVVSPYDLFFLLRNRKINKN